MRRRLCLAVIAFGLISAVLPANNVQGYGPGVRVSIGPRGYNNGYGQGSYGGYGQGYNSNGPGFSGGYGNGNGSYGYSGYGNGPYGYGYRDASYYDRYGNYGYYGPEYSPVYSPFGFGIYSSFTNGW
jgi:hypothetical protein